MSVIGQSRINELLEALNQRIKADPAHAAAIDAGTRAIGTVLSGEPLTVEVRAPEVREWGTYIFKTNEAPRTDQPIALCPRCQAIYPFGASHSCSDDGFSVVVEPQQSIIATLRPRIEATIRRRLSDAEWAVFLDWRAP